jgi:serine/threonine-protein kinase HipA
MQKLAASAGFASWKEAQQCIVEVVEAISQFSLLASQVGISKTTIRSIEKILGERRADNALLIKA